MKAEEIVEQIIVKTKKTAGSQRFKTRKEKEAFKVKTASQLAVKKLLKASSKVRKQLTEFEKELIETLTDVKKAKKEAKKAKDCAEIIKKLEKEYYIKTKYAENLKKAAEKRKQFYGRIASLIKSIDFEALEAYEKALRNLPRIKDTPTIIIAGCPNVGKSELLKRVSGVKVKTAPYPFTTKKLLIGFIRTPYHEIQLIDTPGLLDRDFSKMNKTEKKAIAALKHLTDKVIFVIDPSETCGFSLKEQENLLKRIKERLKPKLMIVATKKDLCTEKYEKADMHLNLLEEKEVEKLVKEIIKFSEK